MAFAANAAETIRLRADQWMPFNGDPAAEKPGYVIEIARRIFSAQDIAVDYQVMPWGDALKAATAGEIEGVVCASRSEAAGLIVPTEPIGFPRVAIFVNKKSAWRYENLTSLLKVRLGVLVDYKYWDALDGYIAKHQPPQVIPFSGDHPIRDAIAKLQSGDIDALPETVPVFSWAAADAGLRTSDFHIAYLHEGEGIFIAFSGRDERGRRYARLLDAGIKNLRKSGELVKILARYGQKDWQE